MRATPFAFVFGDIAPARFPAIAEALEQEGATATDRDRFVLLEPVGRLLRELRAEDVGADVLEAHLLQRPGAASSRRSKANDDAPTSPRAVPAVA